MPGRGLNLLSLDGGGIRGLSSLQVLKNILEKVAQEQGLSKPPKPCEFFNMIGGTSTGGLIAMMLGRMKMSVDDCIEAYIELSDQVFRKTRFSPLRMTGKVQGRFDSKALENSVKKYLRERSLSEDCLLQDVEPKSCKVFVCATSGSTSKTVVLSSYSTKRTNTDRLKYTKVWQAARATSAASTFFDAIEVQFGSYKESYTDGATGANNPIDILWQEAKEAFLEPGEQLEDHVNCVLSIGTGVPSIEAFGHDLKTIAKTIVAISTQTEETAKNFRRNHENLKESGRYFRFNVSHGLERIGLERTDRKNDIINITNHYLEEDETDELLRKCANAMKKHEGEAASNLRGGDTVALRSRYGMNLSNRPTAHSTNDWSLNRRGTNELLESMSVYDHETRLKSISARVMPGTTKWILSNDVFVCWEGNKHITFLLCTGIVGSGKTMLASSAVEELVLKHDGSEEVIAHYFIDARYPEELSTTELLRGIIRQVVSKLTATGRTPQWLDDLLRKHFNSKNSCHGDFVVYDVLSQLLSALEYSVIIIDGLHEFSEHEASTLLSTIRKLSAAPKLSGKVKFAIFTREEIGRNVSIITALPGAKHLKLTLRLLEKDISFLIEERVRQKRAFENILTEDEDLITELHSAIRQKGEKMFLWIELQLNTIWDVCSNDEDIRKALSGLPQGIEETYTRCLERVSQDPKAINYGYSIIHLTAFVQRPLNQAELREAVSVSYMSDHFDKRKLVNGSLLRFCANLVEQDHLTAIVQFVHPSVKAFLEQYFFPARCITSSLVTGKAYPTDANFQTVGMEHCRDICFKYMAMKDFGSELVLHSTVKTSVEKSAVVERALNIGNKGMRLVVRARHLMTKNRLHKTENSHIVLETGGQAPLSQSLQDDRASIRDYHLLKYTKDHWPSHTQGLTPTDPAWPTFVALATRDYSAYRMNPWVDLKTSSLIARQPFLVYAISKNHLPLLWTLQEQFNPQQMVKLIETPINDDLERAIHLAISKEVVAWLIRFGGTGQLAFKDIHGNTVLHFSAAKDNTETLNEVLGHSSVATLLFARNNVGETPITIAAKGGRDNYLDRAMKEIQLEVKMAPPERRELETFYCTTLDSILETRPHSNNRLSMVEPHIRTLVKGLIELGHAKYWSNWVILAIEDDNLLFFDSLQGHKDIWRKITRTMRSLPPKHSRGRSLLGQACTISTTTKADRVQILKTILNNQPEEERLFIFTNTQSEISWLLSFAMSQVTVSRVAVGIVRVFSEELLIRARRKEYVPIMIQDSHRVHGTEMEYTEILSQIDPQSVKDLLSSGALTITMPSHFVPGSTPRNTLLHVAAMKEDSALIEAISIYVSQSKPYNVGTWLADKGNASKSVLSLAFVGNRPRHVLCVLKMIDTFLDMKFEFLKFSPRVQSTFRLEVEDLLTDTFKNLVHAFRDGKIQKDKTEGVSNMAGRLASRIRRNKACFELIAGKYLSEFSLTITKEELEKLEKLAELNESPQQLDAAESGSAQLQHSTILETSIYSDSHIKNLDGQSHGYPLKTSASEESVYLSANEESIVDVC